MTSAIGKPPGATAISLVPARWHLLLHGRVWLLHRALDDRLAHGADPAASAALRLRAHQLTAVRARSRIADALERAVRAAEEPSGGLSAAVPVGRRQVDAARWQLVALVERLRAPRPVWAQGVAMVLQLLVDAASPLYQDGDDLRAAALAAIEALDGRANSHGV
jgi:hypothetical protein